MDASAHLEVTVESNSNANIWCKVQIFAKGMMLQVKEFEFHEPTIQYMHDDFNTMCQFGGVYMKITSEDFFDRSAFMSLCDDSLLRTQPLLLGDDFIDMYIVYFAGYSQGHVTLKLKVGPTYRTEIGKQCRRQQNYCIFTHRIWTKMIVTSGNGSITSQSDNIHAFQVVNPHFDTWLQQYSTAQMSKKLRIVAGQPTGRVSLGTVQLHIDISTTESQPASCYHKIYLDTLTGSNNAYSHKVKNVLRTNLTTIFPSAKYIQIRIQLCPYLRIRNCVISTVRLEKVKVCDVANHYPWPSQTAEDCSHLSLPCHLGSVSFYTGMLNKYKMTISNACVDKSCLEVTIAGYGHSTNQCDVLWKNVDLITTPITIVFPGMLNITYKTKPSCSFATDDLQKCNLEIDIQFDDMLYITGKSQVLSTKKTSDQLIALVAHGRMVTSSRQITEVKQRRARLVLGWVTAARHLPAMCRGVGQAYHITLPLSTQQ